MIQIAPIAPIGVSIPFQNRNKLQPWRTRKNGENLAVFVSKKRGRFGNCRCQKTDRMNDIIGKEINTPVDMVAAEMNANNVLVDRIVADQAERKLRAGTNEKENHIQKEAWNLLRSAVIDYCGSPIGTIAANDPTDPSMLNYDQVFIRDLYLLEWRFCSKESMTSSGILFSILCSSRVGRKQWTVIALDKV